MQFNALSCLKALALASAVFAVPAYAADPATEKAEPETTYPNVSGTIYLELGDDWTFRSDDPGSEIHDVYFYGTADFRLGLSPHFAVNVGFTAEDVLVDYVPFEDRFFNDTGIYLHALNAEANFGNVTLLAGKFGPNFGRAWDNTPGIFGTYFASDYELAEMIGGQASYAFATETMGTHTLGASVFFRDTTFLSDSIITSRGRLNVADGGVANTESLNNFVVSLDGAEFASVPGFSYHAAYRHLAAGDTELFDENGFVFGLAKDTELANGMSLTVNGELAYFDHYAGGEDDAMFATAGAALYSGPWHGELSGSLRRYIFAVGGTQTDKLAQVSAGYTFENGIDVAAGYGFTRADFTNYHTVGLRLTKTIEFPSAQ